MQTDTKEKGKVRVMVPAGAEAAEPAKDAIENVLENDGWLHLA